MGREINLPLPFFRRRDRLLALHFCIGEFLVKLRSRYWIVMILLLQFFRQSAKGILARVTNDESIWFHPTDVSIFVFNALRYPDVLGASG